MSEKVKVCPECDGKLYCPKCGVVIKDDIPAESCDSAIDVVLGILLTLIVELCVFVMISALLVISGVW